MFTGLIQGVGRLSSFNKDAKGATLTVGDARPVLGGAALGDSIAVSGICLTVTDFTDDSFSAYASTETLEASSMGSKSDPAASPATRSGWQAGQLVNLETSLTPQTKMGGHFVQGHVDGVGSVHKLEKIGDSWEIEIAFPANLGPYFVAKGSVALDGISLTVNSVDPRAMTLCVRIIPTTWQETNIHTWQKGTAVNIETDIMGRYVVHYLENYLGQTKGAGSNQGGLDLRNLKEMGF